MTLWLSPCPKAARICDSICSSVIEGTCAALTGQTDTQLPQPVQSSGSIIASSPSPCLLISLSPGLNCTARNGHTLTQSPQPLQRAASIVAAVAQLVI